MLTNPSGGTKFEPVLTRALELIRTESLKKADIIFITDGEADMSFTPKYIAAAKELEVTTYGVTLGCLNPLPFCNQTLDATNLEDTTCRDVLFQI